MKKKKVALFCSWIKSRGGVEKEVLELLSKSKFEIDVYTWAFDPKNTFEEFEKYDIKVIGPKFSKSLSRGFISRGLFLFFAMFSKIPLNKYDKLLVITSGVSEFILFRNYKPNNTYVLVNTPLREASNSIYEWNMRNRDWNFFKKILYVNSVRIYNFFERRAWKKFDYAIYNSGFVERRAKDKNLSGKKNFVVYPWFGAKEVNYSKFKDKNLSKEKYFLYVSRLNPPKRQDLLIEAWKGFSEKKEGYKLYIVGNTETEKYLKKLEELSKEDSSISILQGLHDREINKLYANCLAGIFIPFEEDFGIVPLEVVHANKPLICINEGGFKELLGDSKHVYFVKEKRSKKDFVKEIENVLTKFSKKKISNFRNKKVRYDFVKEMDKVLLLEKSKEE